jgi:hypothetical protein
MTETERRPGIGRDQRISQEGLERLARQMQSGAAISDQVLTQWIRRYGEPARRIIRDQGRYHPGLEPGGG